MAPYMNDQGFAIVEALTETGRSYDASPAQMTIAWILANPTVTSAIIGANTVTQLAETLKAAEIKLSPQEKAQLDRLPSPT
jgi:aryl-alcohol dehydrogenase-like predicted oxidoreductase